MQILEERLDEQLSETFVSLKLDSIKKTAASDYLNYIRHHHEDTYRHSARVGLRAKIASKFMNIDAKSMLFAGLFHDIGKVFVPKHILDKTQGFNEIDREIMKDHSVDGYELLKGIDNFAADVALRIHTHQGEGYPEMDSIPKLPWEYGHLVNFASSKLALIDFYDAITHRNNDKYGRVYTSNEAKPMIHKQFPSEQAWIDEFYKERVF